ncbi:alpha/beta hydrolase [filamentous cyanobacterium CCP2]|nr:alpha/beta hydrolase [filamentous cyanobacterium CCP2]
MNRRKGRLASHYSIANGYNIHTRVSAEPVPADAPVIVLVHGLVISSRYMVPTAELLAPNYRVYAPDLPGYGESEKPAHLLTLPELAETLHRWMDEMAIERAVFLGNSLGCQKIVELAVRHPERVERAILQGPTIDRHARNFPIQFSRILIDSPHEESSQVFVQLYDYWKAGFPRIVHTIRMALEDPIEQKLPQVKVPTLVVRGSLDPVVPQKWAEEVTRLLPQGQLKVIPGVAHTINYSAPLELVRVVEAFLREE